MSFAFLTRKAGRRDGKWYFAGLLLGIGLMDAYKLYQLRTFGRYFSWWNEVWHNMLWQSSGVDTAYDVKIAYLKEMFDWRPWFCLLVLTVSVSIYLVCVGGRLLKKKYMVSDGTLTAVMAGVGGSSLMIYFVLLGGNGLVYARRHTVNELMVKFFMTYLIGGVGSDCLGPSEKEKGGRHLLENRGVRRLSPAPDDGLPREDQIFHGFLLKESEGEGL